MRKAAQLLSAILIPVVLLATGAIRAAEPAVEPLRLRMASGEFSPQAPPQVPAWYRDASRPTTGATGKRYLVAITRGALDAEQGDQLRRAGAELLGYLPDHGYRLRIDPRSETIVRELPFVAWLGELPVQFKVQPALASEVGRATGPVELRVIVAEGEPAGRVLRALRGLPTIARLAGDTNYGIYEGEIGSYYSHHMIDCIDDGDPLTEPVTPSQASSYYLVVPLSDDANPDNRREGSYGTDSNDNERPPGSSVCLPKAVGTCS